MLEVPEELVEDVKLAVSEACTTALNAREDAASPLTVRATANAERMVVEVVDPGMGVQKAVSGAPTEIDTEDLPFENSLSLPIIRGLVDELSVSPYEEGGATLRMVVSVRSGPG